MRIVVLDAFTLDQGDRRVWDGLKARGQTEVYPRTLPEETATRCEGAEVVITNKVVLTAEILARLAPTLKYVGLLATGTNSVDLDAARSLGIAVANVPGYSTESVAQLVFALIMHFTHDVAGHAEDVRAGRWATSANFCFLRQPLMELKDKTMVILGSGAIGSSVARIAKAFEMRVLAGNVPGSPNQGHGSLSEVLPMADIVTLHCPLTEATRGMVDRKFLSALKPQALLINTGRGLLIDQDALILALDAGELGGVGLDVISQEPPPVNQPLLNPLAPWAPKVVVTPHIGWATVEARRRLMGDVLGNFDAFMTGKSLNRVA
jgi:glycerate dehydrogenase